MSDRFIQVKDNVIHADDVINIDCSRLESLIVVITIPSRKLIVSGKEAIDAVMTLKPSALEGTRLKYARRAWLIHNLIGHPVMQLAALCKCYKFAMWIHDVTIPRPIVPEVSVVGSLINAQEYVTSQRVTVSGVNSNEGLFFASVPFGDHAHLYFLKDGTWNESCWPRSKTSQYGPVNGHWSSLEEIILALKQAGVNEVNVETQYI